MIAAREAYLQQQLYAKRALSILLRRKSKHRLAHIEKSHFTAADHYLQELPRRVHVIVSARSAGTAQPERYLEPWLDLNPSPLSVDNLEDHDLAVWLGEQSEPLRTLGTSKEFRELLYKRADGSARFIGDLVAHLENVHDLPITWRKRLDEVPSNYVDFVRRQYRELKQSDRFVAAHESFLGLLCAAEGELSAREIQLVLGDMPKLPVECERWVSIYPGSDGEGDRYTLQTDQIQLALRTVIPWSPQQSALQEHCRNWATHQTNYSLRHFADHFKSDWRSVASLVLDKKYRDTVTRRLVDEPDLPLRILREAMERAIDSPDWTAIAGLMLVSAEVGYRMLDCRERERDPLEQRASEAAEILTHSDRGRAALLRLLQAWTLKWKGKTPADVEKVRQQIDPTAPVKLDGLEADVAATLLTRVFDVDDERLVQIAVRLLDEPARRDLVGILAKMQHPSALNVARELLRTIPRTQRRATNPNYDKAVNVLVAALAEEGRWADLIKLSESQLPRQATLNLAEASRVAARKHQDDALGKLYSSATGVAAHGMTPKDQMTCLANIGRIQALSGLAQKDPEKARTIWDEASVSLEKLKPEQRFHGFRELTFCVLAAVGRPGFHAILSGRGSRRGSLIVDYFETTVAAWQEMSRNEQVSLTSTAHALAKLLRLTGGRFPK